MTSLGNTLSACELNGKDVIKTAHLMLRVFYHILEKGYRRNQEVSFPAIQWRFKCESKQTSPWGLV